MEVPRNALPAFIVLFSNTKSNPHVLDDVILFNGWTVVDQ